MSSRPLFSPRPIIVSGDMSADIVSAPTIIQNLSQIGFDVSWSGSSVSGVASVQISNTFSLNMDGSVNNAGNWTTIDLSPQNPAISGNSGNGFIDITMTSAFAIRFIYTRTAGTGTLNVTLCGKVS